MKIRRSNAGRGLLKRCHCSPKLQELCEHPWHLMFKPKRGLKNSPITGYRDNTGRFRFNLQAHYKESGPVSRERATELAIRARREIEAGSFAIGTGPAADTRLTLGYVATQYLAARQEKGKDHYIEGLRRIEVPAGDGTTIRLEMRPIEDVTGADIEAAMDAWKKRQTRKTTKHGAEGIRKLLQAARHLFNWSIKKRYVTRTPFRHEGVAMFEIKSTGGRDRRLERDEEVRLLAAADPYTKDLMIAALETACRGGELRGLLWSEVFDDHFVIPKEKSKTRKRQEKPITPQLRQILDSRRLGPDGKELPDTAHVFGNEIGQPMARKKVNDLWRETCRRAKVTNLHFHDLRREAGSQLLEAGNQIHDVRDALGHSNITMTNQYLSTTTDRLQKAFKRHAQHRARRQLKLVAGR